MGVTLTEQKPLASPAEERRGGELPDWDQARPGKELPDLGGPRVNDIPDPDDCGVDDRDIAPLRSWCGLPGCGGDLCAPGAGITSVSSCPPSVKA